ncbi:RCC1 domain-containing protein, partial [Salmonella sp. s58408]|uniref:RCC1 domain-containing protein n=1 Tax=Salmonella sp. s58408 TaxID=3159701 RepID=UPI00397E9FD3
TKCFGKNDDGQLGLGDTTHRGIYDSQLGSNLPEVDFGSGRTAKAITAGCSHTCGLLDDGSVKCFGYNNYGQLGQGSTKDIGDKSGQMGNNLKAVSLGSTKVVAIAAGCDFTCAVKKDGAVVCWGRNTWGQLGTGDDEDRLDDGNKVLKSVNLGGSSAIAIAAGEAHVCVLTKDKSVKCWGRNNRGQLGLGDDTDRGDDASLLGSKLKAVSLGSGDTPTAIDCGNEHTCVLL